MAVLKKDIEFLKETMANNFALLRDDMARSRAERKEELGKLCATFEKSVADHEERLRTLEGSNRTGLYRDIGAYISAVVAGIAGFFSK